MKMLRCLEQLCWEESWGCSAQSRGGSRRSKHVNPRRRCKGMEPGPAQGCPGSPGAQGTAWSPGAAHQQHCSAGWVPEPWHREQRAVGAPPGGSPTAPGRGAGLPALGGPSGAGGDQGDPELFGPAPSNVGFCEPCRLFVTDTAIMLGAPGLLVPAKRRCLSTFTILGKGEVEKERH